MNLEDITVGESWACKFRVSTFVDDQGNVVEANLQPGQMHPGKPGVYESLGIIQIRDVENKIVQVLDTKSNKTFAVDWENCWDVDSIDWIENETMA